MATFTAVIPVRSILPQELSLLLSPIRAREPTEPEGYVAQSEGALLDEDDRVVAFIVRLARRFVPTCPRTLVDATAVTVTDDSVLRISWTEAQLLAQPRLDDALHLQDALPGTEPLALSSMATHEGTAAVDDGAPFGRPYAPPKTEQVQLRLTEREHALYRRAAQRGELWPEARGLPLYEALRRLAWEGARARGLTLDAAAAAPART